MCYKKKMYDSYLTTFPEKQAQAGTNSPLLKDLIRRHFPPVGPDIKILDLGCGCGQLLYHLKQQGYHTARGIDISPEQVALAHAQGIQEVAQGDILFALQKEKDESLDVIILYDVVEHFKKDEIFVHMKTVHSKICYGGTCIMHVPNAGSPFFGRVLYGDLSHELAFTPSSARQLLLECGFSSIQCYEDRPVCHGMKSFIRHILWRIFHSLLSFYITIESGCKDVDFIVSQNMLIVAKR